MIDTSYETVVGKTGWGLYYKFLIGLSCTCFCSIATSYMAIAMLLPFASCNMKFEEKDLLNINAVFKIGMTLGGYVNGCSFDLHGRKSMVTSFLVFTFCGCFSAGFATGPGMLSTCVFMVGVGVKSCHLATKIYVMENMPPQKRGAVVVSLDMFWTLGCILAFGASLIYAPILVTHSAELRIASWRMLFAMSGVLCLLTSCFTALIFSSPRFLLSKKQFVDAKEVLRHIYAVNCSQHANNWPITPEIEIVSLIEPQLFEEERSAITCWETLSRCAKRIRILTAHIWKKKFVRITLIGVFLRFALFPGVFTMNLLVARLLSQLKSHSSSSSDLFVPNSCHLNALNLLYVNKKTSGDNCLLEINTALVYESLVAHTIILFGQFILHCIIDRVGRRLLTVSSLFVCGVTWLLFMFGMQYWCRIVVASIFLFCYGVVVSTLDVTLIEAYPTRLRGTANGFLELPAGLIAAGFEMFFRSPCSLAFICYGVILLAATCVASLLPELRNRPMVE